MINKKVAICIPTYNNKSSFERLLVSLREQSHQDYSLFVSDDSDLVFSQKQEVKLDYEYIRQINKD